MPGRIHKHQELPGVEVYHRKDGALVIHGRRHSRYSPGRDRQHHAKDRPGKRGYPHAGDGRPMHQGTNQPIHKGKKRSGKKGRRR